VQLKFIALIVTILGILLIWLPSLPLSLSKLPIILPLSLKLFTLKHFIPSIWFLTPLSSQKILFFPIKLTHNLIKSIDQGWVEILGGKGIFILSSSTSLKLQHLQFNLLTSHILISLFILIPISMILFYLSSLYLKYYTEAVKKTLNPWIVIVV
jgi:hypothetical protein